MLHSEASLTLAATALFHRKMQSQLSMVGTLGAFKSTTQPVEKMVFLAEPPQMEERKGETRFSSLRDALKTVSPRPFTAGIAIKREHLDDDQTDEVMNQINGLASVAMNHPNKLLFGHLNAGETSATLGYDAAPLFSTTHPGFGSEGDQSNLITGAGVTVSSLKTDLEKLVAALLSTKSTNNEPYREDVTEISLYYNPALHVPMLTATGAEIIANTSNVNGKAFKWNLYPSSRLINNGDWYGQISDGMAYPITFLERTKLEFNALSGRDTESHIRRGEYLYQTYYRAEVCTREWQSTQKVKNS